MQLNFAARARGGRWSGVTRFLRRAPLAPDAPLPKLSALREPAEYTQLRLTPPCLLPADPLFYAEYQAGVVALDGRVEHRGQGGASMFALPATNPGWLRAVHGFVWLTHLKAADTADARQLALTLTAEWLARPQPAVAWQPAVASRRALQWLSHADCLLPDADPALVVNLAKALAETFARLARGTARLARPEDRLLPRLATLTAALVLPDYESQRPDAEREFCADLQGAVRADGMPRSRNAATLVELLQDVLALKQIYASLDYPMPEPIAAAVAAMPKALLHMRMGDANLAPFNGVGRCNAAAVATLLTQSGGMGRAPRSSAQEPDTAMCGGYVRLSRDPWTVVMDAAASPLDVVTSHAGPLSMVVSYGDVLVITNQGDDPHSGGAGGTRARASAQHSMLVLAHASAAPLALGPGGSLAAFQSMPRVRPSRASSPSVTDARTAEPQAVADAGAPVQPQAPVAPTCQFEHDGYVSRFGLMVERRLRLCPVSNTLFGADAVREVMTARRRTGHQPTTVSAAIHFHLAPRVTVEREAGDTMRLVLKNGQALRFHCKGQTVTVEPSTFYGSPLGPLDTLQLVVRTQMEQGDEVHWSLEPI